MNRLMTVPEVAALLRMTPWSVYEWVRSGRLVPVPTGGKKLLFRRTYIECMLDGHAIETRNRTPTPAA